MTNSEDGTDYHKKSLMWRAIALFQLPITLIAVVTAYHLATTRNVTLNVPEKPLPGWYPVHEIPDSEFVDVSQEFVNLISTYQHTVAGRQFNAAKELLKEPALSKFEEDMINVELFAIEDTQRSAEFIVKPNRTRVVRSRKNQVVVHLTGDRFKLVSGKQLDPVRIKFKITMTTDKEMKANPFGIVITDIVAEELKPS